MAHEASFAKLQRYVAKKNQSHEEKKRLVSMRTERSGAGAGDLHNAQPFGGEAPDGPCQAISCRPRPGGERGFRSCNNCWLGKWRWAGLLTGELLGWMPPSGGGHGL